MFIQLIDFKNHRMKDGSIFCLRLYLIRLQMENNNNLRFIIIISNKFCNLRKWAYI